MPIVRLGQGLGNLSSVADGLFERQRSFRETLLQGFALDQFHHQKVHSVLVTDIVQGADVRVRQLRDRFGFAFQSLEQVRI